MDKIGGKHALGVICYDKLLLILFLYLELTVFVLILFKGS